jgi:hypothetical protein
VLSLELLVDALLLVGFDLGVHLTLLLDQLLQVLLALRTPLRLLVFSSRRPVIASVLLRATGETQKERENNNNNNDDDDVDD